MQQLKIWRPSAGEKLETADVFEAINFDCSVDQDANLECAAESYAEYFHDNCDGWECSWPMDFHIATMDGKKLGVVTVDREARPKFYGKVSKI